MRPGTEPDGSAIRPIRFSSPPNHSFIIIITTPSIGNCCRRHTMHCNRMIAFCLMLLIGNCVVGQDWPQWRGPNRDNKVVGFTAPREWPKELTKKWRVTVGKGEASPVLVGEKLYVFARQGGDEVTLCLDAASG